VLKFKIKFLHKRVKELTLEDERTTVFRKTTISASDKAAHPKILNP
jgi:hypothetical protein